MCTVARHESQAMLGDSPGAVFATNDEVFREDSTLFPRSGQAHSGPGEGDEVVGCNAPSTASRRRATPCLACGTTDQSTSTERERHLDQSKVGEVAVADLRSRSSLD